MSCGVGCSRGLDPALLWLWHRPAATALIRPLAWEPPYAVEAAQEMAKRPKKKVGFSLLGLFKKSLFALKGGHASPWVVQTAWLTQEKSVS